MEIFMELVIMVSGGGVLVEKKLVIKMIKNCFRQYYEGDFEPLSDVD
jgi:hypothetical protein